MNKMQVGKHDLKSIADYRTTPFYAWEPWSIRKVGLVVARLRSLVAANSLG